MKQESSFDIKITECAPRIFQSIRKTFGVSDDEVLNAFSPLHNSQAIRNFQTGSGQSRSFFLFTDNKRFVLKTVKPSEEKLLFAKNSGVLKHYFKYVVTNRKNLLSKLLGVYKVKL